jgi:hypothetical protein
MAGNESFELSIEVSKPLNLKELDSRPTSMLV